MYLILQIAFYFFSLTIDCLKVQSVYALNKFSLDWNSVLTGNDIPISDIGTLILMILLKMLICD